MSRDDRRIPGCALVPVLLSTILFLSCGSQQAGPGDQGGQDALTCSTPFSLRIVILDIWGRRLPVRTTSVNDLPPVYNSDFTMAVSTSQTLDVSAVSTGFEAGEVRFAIDPDQKGHPNATVVSDDTSFASSYSYGDGCRRLTVYLGLGHPWFSSSGRPARGGNQVALLLDGEEFWEWVNSDLTGASSHVRGSTWWWQSDFELIRPEGHETMSEEQRRSNTVLALLDGIPATKRLLLNRFLPDTAAGMAYLNTDSDIRSRALAPGDDFEVLLQGNQAAVPLTGSYEGAVPAWSFIERAGANPEFAGESFPGKQESALIDTFDAASYHQKVFAIDGTVAYVSGMNVKSTDWDTNDHRVFDSKRMKYSSGSEERQRVKQKMQLPDVGPRKDYGIRIAGPAARDVDDVLKIRWDQGIAEKAMYHEHATPFVLEPVGAEYGSVTCQVVTTMPPPIAEQSILETWAKALARSNSYIFIEDQYFRMPVLNDVIVDTLRDRPWVTLIVVTKPVSAADGGKKYTVETDNLFRAVAPQRYLLLQLKSFDAVGRPNPQPGDETDPFYFVNMDVHSKILIVDDAYLSVGSCNKNNRGLLYEGEMNVSVLDDDWTRDARRRIYGNLVGPFLADQVSDDPDANFVLLKEVASLNAEVEAWWLSNGPALSPAQVDVAKQEHHPQGFVYPLSFTPDYLLEVGPDAF